MRFSQNRTIQIGCQDILKTTKRMKLKFAWYFKYICNSSMNQNYCKIYYSPYLFSKLKMSKNDKNSNIFI